MESLLASPFSTLPQLFVAAFVTALSGALMPGPVLFVTVRHSAASGRRAGPLVVLGHAVVEVPLMAAVILGLRPLLESDAFVGAVGLAGGLLLGLMSVSMLRSLPELELPKKEDSGDSNGTGALGVIGAGAATSLANPYFTIWWATIGMRFLAGAARFALAGYVVFYTGHVLADLAWYAGIAEAVHRGRRVLSDTHYRWLVGVCAVLLIVFALLFLHDGAGRLVARL